LTATGKETAVLCITRKIGAVTEVKCPDGQSIFITARNVGTKNIGLGIDAPKEYVVLRDNAKKTEPKEEVGNG
jgi:sRNA-binding carbon storage regulator CsrA